MGRKHRRRIERLMKLMVRRRHLTPEELEVAEVAAWTPELVPFIPEEDRPR